MLNRDNVVALCLVFAAPLAVMAAPGLALAQGMDEPDEIAEGDEPADLDLSDDAEALAPPSPDAAASQDASAATLQSIVRGLYLEARVGGGLAVTSADIPADPVFPRLEGASEDLGSGGQIGFHLGYDVTESLALEAVTGAALVSGRRTDRVRDIGMFYGGVGLRLSFELERRLNFAIGGAGTFVRADNGIEAPDSGFGILVATGLEYFVHVRHFSVGLDVSALAPLSPSRIFVALMPRIKYTF